MNRHDVETNLHRIVRNYVGRDVGADEAIYQDAGLNGMDFYEFMIEVRDTFSLPDSLPEFRWDEFADMPEPPEGLSLFGRLRVLPRKRLTVSHLGYVIARGKWSDPLE